MSLFFRLNHFIILPMSFLYYPITHVSHYSITLPSEDGEVLVDYSKDVITSDTMKLLFNLVGVNWSGLCLASQEVGSCVIHLLILKKFLHNTSLSFSKLHIHVVCVRASSHPNSIGFPLSKPYIILYTYQ